MLVSFVIGCSSGNSGDSFNNTAPIANGQAMTIDEDVATVITLNASDAEDNSLTYIINQPVNGSISGNGPDITYTPNVNFNGNDSFTYHVNDGSLDSATATISIVINPLNDLVSFQAASVVIGQVDFTETTSNQGGAPGANTVAGPYGNPGVANGILYLPDYSNNRLLGFNSIPAINNSAANFVLGQVNFSSTTAAVSALGFSGTQTVAFDDNKMFLAENSANRILIWNSIPANGGVPADIVLGQADFDISTAGVCSSTGLSNPETLWAVNGKLIVTDSVHNRVLIWNTIPSSNNIAADLVLGQQDFDHCGANDTDNDGASDTPSASTLFSPAGVWSDGNRIVVLDNSNHRVLIWNSFPSTNFAPADVVLGQSDFTHNAANDDDQNTVSDGAPTVRTLSGPYDGVYSNGRQLYVADTNNNRVLIWNEFPTSNFTPADVVLGQANFTLNAPNDDNADGATDSASARTLNFPSGIYLHGNQLIVAEGSNSRYLIYNE